MSIELMRRVLDLLGMGKRNAVTAAVLSRRLGLNDGITSEDLRLGLIKPMIEEHGIPIGSCSRGYYILEEAEEFEEVIGDLNHRIRGMQNRKRGLRRGWNRFQGERPVLEEE